MADREGVVRSWRSRLAYWRERLGGRQPWRARAYVRVLSYLLARYAPEWKLTGGKSSLSDADSLAEDGATDRSRMTFYQAPALGEGKPPRTGDAIRSVLETVRKLQPQRNLAGPLVQGLPPEEWIAVAAFYDRAELERLRWMLESGGIAVRFERARRMRKALVRVADKERAKPIVLKHASDCRESSRGRKQYAAAWAQLGAACGFILGGIAVVAAVHAAAIAPGDRTYDLFAGLIGGMLGSFAGLAVGFIAGTIADG